jgi:hypothetical protein
MHVSDVFKALLNKRAEADGYGADSIRFMSITALQQRKHGCRPASPVAANNGRQTWPAQPK